MAQRASYWTTINGLLGEAVIRSCYVYQIWPALDEVEPDPFPSFVPFPVFLGESILVWILRSILRWRAPPGWYGFLRSLLIPILGIWLVPIENHSGAARWIALAQWWRYSQVWVEWHALHSTKNSEKQGSTRRGKHKSNCHSTLKIPWP